MLLRLLFILPSCKALLLQPPTRDPSALSLLASANLPLTMEDFGDSSMSPFNAVGTKI